MNEKIWFEWKKILAVLQVMWYTPANALQTHSLREQFQNPSDEAKPWTFWYWMFGAVSKEGITADLEAMKRAVPALRNSAFQP